MLSKRDGPGAIGVVLIAAFRLLPGHQVCSTLLFRMFYCFACRIIVFHNGFIVMCLTSTNITIVNKNNVSNTIAIIHSKSRTKLSRQDGPGAIRVVLIASVRLLPEHPVCSTLLFCFLRFCCDVFAYIAFYFGCVAI